MKAYAYRAALGLAVFSVLFLVWGTLALGIIGVEGDSADRMYFGVVAVGLVGAIAVRLRAAGMVRVMLAMALAQGVVTVIALLAGKHESPVTSVYELVGLNAMFAALFCTSAWLFWLATTQGTEVRGNVAPEA